MNSDKLYRLGKYSFSHKEIDDLFKSWLILSLAFGIILSDKLFDPSIINYVGLSAITVGVAFIFHELAHKFVAQKYGLYAEFRANYTMLYLALIMSLLGFIFVAPGAVTIRGHPGKSRYGRVSMAGPLMNIILAGLFGAIFFTFGGVIAYYGLLINSWLALFNMLPIPMFDGKKIYAWNKEVFWVMLITSGIMVMMPYMV